MSINQDLNLTHYKYPSIEQYRNVIHQVKHKVDFTGQVDENGDAIYQTNPKPTLTFQGTTKLHGTNAAVVIDFKNDLMYYQSRTHIITPAKDNAGFALFMSNIQDGFLHHFIDCYHLATISPEYIYVIYGEWCGQSIQKGVAITQLPKMFVIFDICLVERDSDKKVWLQRDEILLFNNPNERVYNIHNFPTWTIDIDFNYPELSQNHLIDITTEVEKCCPVAHQLGVDGIGEGVVYKCITPGYENSMFWMKVKGTEHSSSKVKTLASVDVESVANIAEFCDNTVTESRLLQGLHWLKEEGKPLTKASLGDFIRWIYNDIIKEEIDTIVANKIDAKKLPDHNRSIQY